MKKILLVAIALTLVSCDQVQEQKAIQKVHPQMIDQCNAQAELPWCQEVCKTQDYMSWCKVSTKS